MKQSLLYLAATTPFDVKGIVLTVCQHQNPTKGSENNMNPYEQLRQEFGVNPVSSCEEHPEGALLMLASTINFKVTLFVEPIPTEVSPSTKTKESEVAEIALTEPQQSCSSKKQDPLFLERWEDIRQVQEALVWPPVVF